MTPINEKLRLGTIHVSYVPRRWSRWNGVLSMCGGTSEWVKVLISCKDYNQPNNSAGELASHACTESFLQVRLIISKLRWFNSANWQLIKSSIEQKLILFPVYKCSFRLAKALMLQNCVDFTKERVTSIIKDNTSTGPYKKSATTVLYAWHYLWQDMDEGSWTFPCSRSRLKKMEVLRSLLFSYRLACALCIKWRDHILAVKRADYLLPNGQKTFRTLFQASTMLQQEFRYFSRAAQISWINSCGGFFHSLLSCNYKGRVSLGWSKIGFRTLFSIFTLT